jgi:hypothetical protein
LGLIVRTGRSFEQTIGDEIDGFSHAYGGVFGGIVVVFDPEGELPVEGIEGGEVELADKELVPDGTEETLNLSSGCAVANG